MPDIRISVIVTCYNLGSYLEEAVASVKNYLPRDNYEIIIVNDGSTDNATIAVLKKIAEEQTDVFILNQQNTGLGIARNNGIRLAKGDYIIPLDADNKLRPAFFERSLAILDANPETDVVYGNAQFFGNKDSLWKVRPFDFSEMVLNNYIDACACFRKSVWESLGGYDEKMPVMGFEDWDLWLRMAVKGCKFKYVDEVFFDYRVRDNSMLSDAWQKRKDLIDYIFNKKGLSHLLPFRNCLIENQRLQQEPSIKEIIGQVIRKVKRKIRFPKR